MISYANKKESFCCNLCPVRQPAGSQKVINNLSPHCYNNSYDLATILFLDKSKRIERILR
jgi:hypothetical protein